MVVKSLIMNHTGVIKVYLIGTRKYAYRLKFKRATVPEWVITAINSIGDKSIGFEDEAGAGAEDSTDISGDGELGLGLGLPQDTNIDQETDPDDQEYDGAGEKKPKYQLRRSQHQEPLRRGHRPTPIVFDSSRMPSATPSM